MAGARTRAAEKGSGDDLQTPEFAVRSSVGASGSLLKALRRKELAAIREAKNARAVEGVVVGLRRFSPNDDGPFGRITLRPYTHDRTLTLSVPAQAQDSPHRPIRAGGLPGGQR